MTQFLARFDHELSDKDGGPHPTGKLPPLNPNAHHAEKPKVPIHLKYKLRE